MCASCWAAVQYIHANGGRDTTVPFQSTAIEMSYPWWSPFRYGSGIGSCIGVGIRAASSAASGVTQADIDVANDLPRNGPSGTYSQAWLSRADQSLRPTTPNTWSANASYGTGAPRSDP